MNALLAEHPLLPSQAWPILAAAALGMIALCILLPRPRPLANARLLGAACLGLGLAAVALVVFRTVRFSVEAVLFYIFSAIAIVSAGVMITRTNPARAALSFAVVVLSTTGLFLLQAAPFLMAATIIIYAGAIIVTFLFVIMLAQPGGASDADQRSREPLLATIAGFFLLATLLMVLRQTYTTGDVDELLTQISAAQKLDTKDAITAALGSQSTFVDRIQSQVYRLPRGGAADRLQAAADSAPMIWSSPTVERAKKELDAVFGALTEARSRFGHYAPSDRLVLSPMAGAPPNAKSQPLSADNVADLGRTLFSDYLLAVEIAGTMLLVATIGAIAIAHRPTATRRAA